MFLYNLFDYFIVHLGKNMNEEWRKDKTGKTKALDKEYIYFQEV